jgi:hypothetical protein
MGIELKSNCEPPRGIYESSEEAYIHPKGAMIVRHSPQSASLIQTTIFNEDECVVENFRRDKGLMREALEHPFKEHGCHGCYRQVSCQLFLGREQRLR